MIISIDCIQFFGEKKLYNSIGYANILIWVCLTIFYAIVEFHFLDKPGKYEGKQEIS